MTGLVRKAALLSACGLTMAAGAAFAGIPDATFSEITPISATGTAGVRTIPVVYLGSDNVTPQVGAATEGANPGPNQRTVTVRDFANNPISGALVKINFGLCCDVELCSATGQAGVTADIVGNVVSGFTNAGGQFVFTIAGAGQNVNVTGVSFPDGCVSGVAVLNPALKTVKVTANVGSGDVLIKQPTGYVFNQDGGANGGVGPSGGSASLTGLDISRSLNDALDLGALTRGRSDFNHDGQITGADVGRLLNEVTRNVPQSGTVCGSSSVGNRVATCP